jgi:hypothetical protein
VLKTCVRQMRANRRATLAGCQQPPSARSRQDAHVGHHTLPTARDRLGESSHGRRQILNIRTAAASFRIADAASANTLVAVVIVAPVSNPVSLAVAERATAKQG